MLRSLNSVRVTACYRPGTRSTANRLCKIKIGKTHNFGSHIVEVRSSPTCCPLNSNIAISHVVGENDQDVGAAFSRRGQRQEAGDKTGEEGEDTCHGGGVGAGVVAQACW